MRRIRFLLLSLISCLPLACASATAWVGQHVNPVPAPADEVKTECQRLPAASRDHVHAFLVNGLDPNHFCNFHGLGEYLLAAGYRNVYFGQMWDCRRCEQRVRQLRRDDPQARIVFVGYSAGVYLARDLSHTLNRDGVGVDLLVYLGGDVLTNAPDDRPVNVSRVVNVRGRGMVFLAGGIVNGVELTGCDNHMFDVRHSALPSDRRVLELLARELNAQAVAVR